jgi:hypothetical protein
MMLFDGNCLLPPDGCAHFFCDGVDPVGMNGAVAGSSGDCLFHSEVDPFPEVLPLGGPSSDILQMTVNPWRTKGTAPCLEDSADDIRTNEHQPMRRLFFVSCLIAETALHALWSLYPVPSGK